MLVCRVGSSLACGARELFGSEPSSSRLGSEPAHFGAVGKVFVREVLLSEKLFRKLLEKFQKLLGKVFRKLKAMSKGEEDVACWERMDKLKRKRE